MIKKFKKGFCPIFDFHVHLLGVESYDDQFLEFAKDWNMPFGVSCLGPNGDFIMNPTPDEFIKSNDMVIKLAENNPKLVYGFCYVNPIYIKESLLEMERCVSSYGMVGVKLWLGCRCNDERIFPIVEKAIELNVPILQHAYLRLTDNLPGESYPIDVAFLASRYPQTKIIMAHIGHDWQKGIAEIKDYSNVWVDTSGLDPESGLLEHTVDSLGVDRVLYGSDAPGRDVLCQIGKVVSSDISEADMMKVLNDNAVKLLGLNLARSRS